MVSLIWQGVDTDGYESPSPEFLNLGILIELVTFGEMKVIWTWLDATRITTDPDMCLKAENN